MYGNPRHTFAVDNSKVINWGIMDKKGQKATRRRGGARDLTELTIGLNHQELFESLEQIRQRCEQYRLNREEWESRRR